MVFDIKNVNKIQQIVRLKQVMQRWKTISLNHRHSDPTRKRIPSGCLAVYVGIERRRFVIPMRFLNLPIFASFLEKAEEEYGFQSSGGGLELPCEVALFEWVLKMLERDEVRFGGIGLDDFLIMFSQLGFNNSSCKDLTDASHGFLPLLHKTRA